MPHLHSQYELYYNVAGAKGFFADKKLYACEGYDLFIVPSACVHKVLVGKGQEYERCIINIDSRVIDAINAAPYLGRPLSWLNGPVRKVNLTRAQHLALIELIDQYAGLQKSALRQYAKLMEILALIGELFPIGKQTGGFRAPGTLAEEALVLIEEQFRDLKIAALSEALFVGQSHLSRVFKEEYGITLTRYLLIRKIAEAKKYLYMGASVKEACFLSGFHDCSNFIRTFKKMEGYSPGSLEKLTDPL